MSCPRIEVDLDKIRRNTQTVVRRLGLHGIGVTGVTKAVCGHPAIAQAMLDGGVLGLADARLNNVQRLRQAGILCPITLIRTPMLSQAEQIVQFCEASYNTERAVIRELGSAARRKGTVHGVILMVEMGDQRDGILPQNLSDMAQQVIEIPGVALKGIGANFACLSGGAPTASQMATFCDLAHEINAICGPICKVFSGGNSASLPWAFAKHSPGCVNDLRLGEAILLGVEPVSGDPLDGMHTDAFTLVAEVIETRDKAATVNVDLAYPKLAQRRGATVRNMCRRHVLAIGHQDTDMLGLSMPAGSTFIGATSDHLVIASNSSAPKTGSELRFQVNYSALMHAMAAPDIDIKLRDDRPTRRSEHPPGKVGHVTLM